MEFAEYGKIGKYSDLTKKSDRAWYRFFEMLPGILTWATLILVVVLSFYTPTFISIFIILFDIYWLIKTMFLSFHMRSSFNKMKENMKIDWLKKIEQIPAWTEIYHLVVLPMATEPIEVVRASFESLASSHYPLEKMIVVLATEERVGERAEKIAQTIEQEFSGKFFKFLATRHPGNIVGEIAGKGSNETWAGREVKKLIDNIGINYESIVVSVFDIDTVVPADYFARLTYCYLTAEKPLRSSFQPIPIFTNNIWQAPSFARVFAFSTTFWQLIQQARPEQLVTFSSHSIGFKALADIDFWQANVVSEDSRIFWQCLLRYDGDWQTVPMYYPVYMDANVAPTFWKTIWNQYKQIRRWHFGVENNPYFMFGFLKNKKIPKKLKLYHSWTMTEKTHSSATNALIIFLLGWLPVYVGGHEFNLTILSYNLPGFTRDIMTLAMFGLVTSAILSVTLLPPKPPEYGRWKWVMMILQWLLFPINFIFFGAIPAVDAQTRLMFKRYLGFWVTPKHRSG